MVEYVLLQANTPGELQKKVNEYLEEGWWLWGNTFFTHHEFIYPFAQAMTKKRDD